MSAVHAPGTAIWRTWSSALATTRPASRIKSISRGLLSLITGGESARLHTRRRSPSAAEGPTRSKAAKAG